MSLPAVCMCAHDDHWFVTRSLQSFAAAGPAAVFVSRLAWDGTPGPWQRVAVEAERAGAEVVVGDWAPEKAHRSFALQEMRRRGHRHVFIPDGDEIVDPKLLGLLLKLAASDATDLARVRMDTYWKSSRYVIRPREELAPILMLDCQTAEHQHIREYSGSRPLTLGPEHGVLHHLSYAGPDERILRKISTWGHRDEVGEDWYRKVWLGWDRDPLMTNLHPTHPGCYGWAERIEPPEILSGVWDEREVAGEPHVPSNWPKVSVIVPLHGGPEDLRACLASLERCGVGSPKKGHLLHEVIVIDDLSPDSAPEVCSEFPFVKLLKNEVNLGFAATSNKGYEASTGEVALFLNSDTRVPRSGLIRLIETLQSSGSVGASGPYTNNAGYDQPIRVNYADPANMDLFADDFANRPAFDEDVPLLVGFCLAVKRSVLDEVGLFDTRFGRGLYEDTDLCYRIQRAGYRLVLSARAFVHHEGSKSLGRIGEHPAALLKRNKAVYESKWRGDLESGFATHLPGQMAPVVRFDRKRSPERLAGEMARLCEAADVSLCMIVRNEERVLGDCLNSIHGVFRQVIIVDTGSSDRTVEIAKEHGAEVYEMAWPESFAEARNESLRHAKGRWIFWMDADDTLPAASAHAILQAAINAPKSVTGFVVPVQFVEEGPGAGTRVDHVKLIRNFSGIRFEGRIHEQILASIREYGGEVGRLDAVVLHSGYDSTVEGQAKKRKRDRGLLYLDLVERPKHPFVLFNLGMTAHYCNRHHVAIGWLRRSLAVSQQGESHLRKVFSLLGVSQRELGRLNDALESFQKGLEVVGEDPELRFHSGIVLSALGRFEEAREQYLAVQPDISGHFSSVDVGILTFKRFHNLGVVCEQLGRYLEAKEFWMQAIGSNPYFSASGYALFEAALACGDASTAKQAAEAVGKAENLSEGWAVLEARLAAMLGQNPDERLWSLARQYPDRPGPGMLLARRMLERGEEQQVQPLLKQLDDWGCAEAAFFRGVSATRQGDFEVALEHMRRALQLNPAHEQTQKQVVALEAAVSGHGK